MAHGIAARGGRGHGRAVADVAVHEPRREAAGGRRPGEDDGLVAGGGEGADDGPAQVAGAARDQDAHMGGIGTGTGSWRA